MLRKNNLKRFILISLLVHLGFITLLAMVFRNEVKVAVSNFFEVSTVRLASQKRIDKKSVKPDSVFVSTTNTNVESKKSAIKSKSKPIDKKKTLRLAKLPVSDDIKKHQKTSDDKTNQSLDSGKKLVTQPPLILNNNTEDAYPDYSANPKPPYPIIARRRGYEGTVMLKVLVLEDGKVGKIDLEESSSYKILDSAAIKAVDDWSFIPGKKNGVKLASWVKVPVKFRLKDY